MAKWWNKAAVIQVDMERDVYDWEGKECSRRRRKDGTPLAVKKQILIDCGLSEKYPDQNNRVWNNPQYLALVKAERDRRDHGITDLVGEIEKVSGPLVQLRTKMHEHVKAIFEAGPGDPDDGLLSADQYQKGALQWSRYVDELVGRTKSQEQQGIDAIMASLLERDRVTTDMVGEVAELLKRHREEQDRKLGIVEGHLEELG